MADDRHKHEAIEWLIRQRDPAFADWTGLTAWLEADQANADAYDELSLLESSLAERLSQSNDQPAVRHSAAPSPARRWSARWIGGAVAAGVAALAALFLVPGDWTSSPSYYAVATPAGARQTLVLEGGTRVSLNGDTRVLLDRSDPQFARLLHGEANFDIANGDSKQFQVEVGDARLVDIGTSFNVLKTDAVTEVQVAEGAIEYRSGGAVVRVDAGEQLRASADELLMSKVDPSEVASWREGRLIFQGKPLAMVADEISRNIGKRVTVDRRIASRPVTAVIQMPSHTEELAPQLERLLGVKVKQSDNGWMLMSPD